MLFDQINNIYKYIYIKNNDDCKAKIAIRFLKKNTFHSKLSIPCLPLTFSPSKHVSVELFGHDQLVSYTAKIWFAVILGFFKDKYFTLFYIF